MKGLKKWNKLKLASRFGRVTDDKQEDQEADKDVAFKIFPLAAPRHIYKTSKDSRCFPRPVRLSDCSAGEEVDIAPDDSLSKLFVVKLDREKSAGHHQPFSHSDCNTVAKSQGTSSMNHREGGWPCYVKTENKEAKNKYLSRVMKEDLFKFTTIKLAQTISKVLKENNTVNLEQIYFTDEKETTKIIDENESEARVTIICKLKDFSKRRRPVSCLSWQKSSPSSGGVVAVSHCSPVFQGCHGETCCEGYICDISVSSCYKTLLAGPGHITALEFNEREVSLLAAGCYDGQVCFFDERTPPGHVGLTDFTNSHSDAVYGIKWVGKSGVEFLTGSQDGLVKWWDVRNFVRPTRQFVVTCQEGDQQVERADSLSCLSFEQTIPSKFMMGTNQGNVISCRLSPKQGTNSQLLAAWKKVSSSVICDLRCVCFSATTVL